MTVRNDAGCVRIALVGDYNPAVTAHQCIPEALRLACAEAGVAGDWRWLHTSTLGPDVGEMLAEFDGVWCVPASPYASSNGALGAIRFARENARPFLGTCGGFQHALLEYAAAVWGIEAPAHAETNPTAPAPVIAPLACALVEQRGVVRFAPGSRLAAVYRVSESVESYHCRFGLNPVFASRLAEGPLRATGWDQGAEIRAVELAQHPFFIATLFQPERGVLAGAVPPLVRAFVLACAARRAPERTA
jgi:CTP synthase (UTP-ammonia lyase)